MLARFFQINTRIAFTPLRTAIFKERETASENKYIREKELEHLKTLEAELKRLKDENEKLKSETKK
ncbi:hypothetical protein BX661DRAFT_196511 [Kickxella alabastrina]|uniref:uncharacterized protein n=1 Tax=Kickxella alabastrina TaxID=61397 RepID=UPI00221FBE09|nr:uncharacterized protein BX661DRAFT_196511 [Kickxella alabastrina]KAI7833295.1 hypothetical protein BX661DRAFT_196511 [Kickxella alabastrina]